jgi:hypothetical protein
VIDSSLRSARSSSCNTKKLRKTGIVSRQGRLRLRLGYRGRKRTEVIFQRFSNSTLNEQQSQESSTSILIGPDWWKMNRLVRSAVSDQSEKDPQKLSRSLHSISVQIQRFQHENMGLKEALAVKKKHKKCGKPLGLQQRQEYHGGAVLWSPRKVREACARETVREREEKELQLQKAERSELKKAAQLYKLKIAEEKRVAREEAKVVREKEKAERAEKAAQRARNQQARNAEKAIQSSQNSKRKVSQPPSGQGIQCPHHSFPARDFSKKEL